MILLSFLVFFRLPFNWLVTSSLSLGTQIEGESRGGLGKTQPDTLLNNLVPRVSPFWGTRSSSFLNDGNGDDNAD